MLKLSVVTFACFTLVAAPTPRTTTTSVPSNRPCANPSAKTTSNASPPACACKATIIRRSNSG